VPLGESFSPVSGQIRVTTVASVPEPSTWLLMLAAGVMMAALIAARSRSRFRGGRD
jgi:hypothetical protein